MKSDKRFSSHTHEQHLSHDQGQPKTTSAQTSLLRPGTIASAILFMTLLSGCGNVTGLMNANSSFGCPMGDGVSCSTLSQTYEREDSVEQQNHVVKAVYEGQSLSQEDVAPIASSQTKITHHKSSAISSPNTARTLATLSTSNTDTIVETTTVRRYPEGLQSTDFGEPTTLNGSHSKKRTRTPSVKKFNETVLASKPRRLQTSAAANRPSTFAGGAQSAAVSAQAHTLDRARKHERVVMLWVLPWVDDQGDLHEASRLWMRIEDAGWKIESVRTRAFEAGFSGVLP